MEAGRQPMPAGVRPDPPSAKGAHPQLRFEILLKKAATDSGFLLRFMNDPMDAAESIDLALTPTEVDILTDTPKEQLSAMIDGLKVSEKESGILRQLRGLNLVQAFAELGPNREGVSVPVPNLPAPTGIRPDRVTVGKEVWSLPATLIALFVVVALIYLLLRWLGIL